MAKTAIATLVSTGFTATGLADALARVTDVPDSAEAVGRLQSIINGLCSIPLTDGRTLLTEAVKVNENIKTRASEARQIIGAYKLVTGFSDKLNGIGWHKAVKAARDALAAANITATGARIKTDAEKDAAKLIDAAADLQEEALLNDPEGALGKTLKEYAVAAAQKMAWNDANATADRIYKTKGAGFCIMLVEALTERATRPTVEEQPLKVAE